LKSRGVPQNLYGYFETEKNLVLTGIPTTDDPAHSLGTVPATLYAAYCSSTAVLSNKNEISPLSEWNTWLS